MRAELGWRSIKNEIGEKKMSFWEHVARLPEERWVKQALMETLKGEYRSEWYLEVLKAREKVGANTSAAHKEKWKRQIRMAWRKKEETDWQKNDRRLMTHPKEPVFETEDYILG